MVLLIQLTDKINSEELWRFTFQYGSINTIKTKKEYDIMDTLHSNMVLLIHKRSTFFKRERNHFTFQYGSINTAFRVI